jgi:murein L,D-transpeptidase YafK
MMQLMSRGRLMFASFVLAGLIGLLPFPSVAEPSPWVLVDTRARTLSVYQGGGTIAVFKGVALGRGGVSPSRRAGDGKTPTGVFFVAWINPDSPYHLFFGLDYPAPVHVEEAHRTHVIDDKTYSDFLTARDRGALPPQYTVLGGNIGIHGLGNQDPEIHRLFNWTMGCVALTDQQIDELARWVTIGTMVIIR